MLKNQVVNIHSRRGKENPLVQSAAVLKNKSDRVIARGRVLEKEWRDGDLCGV